MKAIKYSILFFMLIFAVSAASAQKTVNEANPESASGEPLFWFGPYAGLNLNFHLSDFSRLPGYPCCSPLFESGNGIGFAAGLLFELPLAPKWILDLRLGYITLDGKLTTDERIGNTLSRDEFEPNESVDAVIVEHSIDSRFSAVSFEPTAQYNIIAGLNAMLGFRLAYIIAGDFDIKEEITSPANVVFLENGLRTRNKADNQELPDLSAFQFMLTGGISYDLPIGDRFYLTPEIKYYLPFTNVTSADSVNSWKVHNLHLGLALKIPVFPSKAKPREEETIYLRDTNVIADINVDEEEVNLISSDEREEIDEKEDIIIERTIITEKYEKKIKMVSNLFVKLEAFGIKADGTRQENPTVIIEEIEAEESFPVLPYVFFPEGSADLKNTKMRLLSKAETSSFSAETLPWKTLEIYSDMLNIVGKRMTEYPDAKLTITGCNNNTAGEENNLALSDERAKAVKEYLTSVWGISGDRIALKSQGLPDNPGNIIVPDGKTENQRAELSSNESRLFKYLTLKEIIKTANPPRIEIAPEVKSDAELRSWSVTVEQNKNRLRDYGGQTAPSSIEWIVDEKPLPELEAPVKITLGATDILGQKAVAEKEIEFKQLTINKKRYELKDDKRIERFALILFDFNKANITPEQVKVIKDIQAKIQPNSQVTIYGYADRTGDRDYNRDLALRRSQEVQKYLQVAPDKLKIVPVGNDIELYDNDFAEGRSYSRTVRVIIETPVK